MGCTCTCTVLYQHDIHSLCNTTVSSSQVIWRIFVSWKRCFTMYAHSHTSSSKSLCTVEIRRKLRATTYLWFILQHFLYNNVCTYIACVQVHSTCRTMQPMPCTNAWVYSCRKHNKETHYIVKAILQSPSVHVKAMMIQYWFYNSTDDSTLLFVVILRSWGVYD
jgi:hypothetical protein